MTTIGALSPIWVLGTTKVPAWMMFELVNASWIVSLKDPDTTLNTRVAM